MDSSNKILSCINLSRILPISKLEQNINAISSLVYNDDETLETFLQKVDQPLIVQNERGGFICCEYNRDGDSYRFPGTIDYIPPIKDGIVPNAKLLELEKTLNYMFKVYTKFYYSSETICSVYCYDIDESNQNDFIIAILIRNKIENSTVKGHNGIWEASNLIKVEIDPVASTVNYELISSVNVYLNAGIQSGKNSKLTVSGSMTKKEVKKSKYEESEPSIQFHTENIGTLVESLETKIRDEIEVIYFQKTTQIVSDARNCETAKNAIADLRNIIK